jgi:hypothetical protein
MAAEGAEGPEATKASAESRGLARDGRSGKAALEPARGAGAAEFTGVLEECASSRAKFKAGAAREAVVPAAELGNEPADEGPAIVGVTVTAEDGPEGGVEAP